MIVYVLLGDAKMLKRTIATAAVFGALALNATSAWSEDTKDYGGTAADPITKKECGDCHMAFAPIQLPGRSWRLIMSDLSNHFGEDASLDADTVKHIEEYLVSKSMDEGGTMYGSMTYKRLIKSKTVKKLMKKQKKKPQDYTPIRITDLGWWKGAHSSKKYRTMLTGKATKTGANCVLCHKSAEKGAYEEFDNIPG